MDMNEEDNWFEITVDLFLDPGAEAKKLRLYADVNVPKQMIEDIREESIPIITAVEDGFSSHSDNTIVSRARKLERVLLTFDNDFWNDNKFPLQKIPGIILIDIPSSRISDALKSFWLVYETFARFQGNWYQMKIRALDNRYFMKGVSWDGDLIRYEVKQEKGVVLAREVSAS